ncbi:hypothetical protein CR159_03340 [Pollutimonas subterranea]|uniref:Dehydrogenase (Flavoprotein) n=1 Tax=Pollutimonas subterranea TaxID=2045210 RepID=A0A2N4U8F0_9BURK|nr:glycine oxidase maturase GoxB [Pollutimonas subterranea]PLC51279.1 hypothetical protein CR159_03340 [Pollutimonas subterranea]
MNIAVDVAVVGGGIAAAATCIALSRYGIEPLWIGPSACTQHDPVGESLAPAANAILTRLGLQDLLDSPRHRPANTTFSAWGSSRLVERNAIIHLDGPGRVLDRRIFESGLSDRAAAVALRHTCTLASVVPLDDNGWRLTLADGVVATARFVIDASGRGAAVGRHLSAYRRADNLAAAAVILRQHDSPVAPTPATLIEAQRDGWWYASLLADGRLSLVYFSDPDILPAGLSRDPAVWRRLLADTDYIGRWVSEAGFVADRAPRLASAGTTWLDRACGWAANGAAWAAVGDAAAAFDPLSSHGITSALWCATRVGDAAVATLAGDRAPLTAYADALEAGRKQFLAQRAVLYGREGRFADSAFWVRRRSALDLTESTVPG